ncbi:MAG: hypothetical protein HFJ17_03095 [Clostridia bacterium]|nr:hypothetical protein [Clostridia bacterium]
MILSETKTSIAPDLSTFFGNENLANFYNDDVNEIMRYINNIKEEKELQEKYQKLYDTYCNEVPYIGITRSKIAVITNSYLTGEIGARWYNLFFGFKEWYTS